jgi:mannose-6-phosphate isomerase-like protein (cupin superfamily)
MIAMSMISSSIGNSVAHEEDRGAFGGLEMADAEDDLSAASHVFSYASLPVRTAANGGQSRSVMHGRLATGEEVALHESTQPAGALPNPAHRIQHSEIICVREGTLEFLHDSKTERVGSGGIIFVAEGTMHQVRNVGDGPAAYFVVAIGGDVN